MPLSAKNARQALILAILVAAASIAGAWAFQLIGGYLPCKLCLQERIPYYVGLPVLLVALALSGLQPRLATALAALAALIFLAGAGLGTYHAGAEWAFWQGPTDCGGANAVPTDAGNLMAALQSTRLVSCTEVTLRILGLSFAGWNVVVSLAVVVLSTFAALALRRSVAVSP